MSSDREVSKWRACRPPPTGYAVGAELIEHDGAWMMAYVTDGERLMEGINDEILRAELKDDVSFGSVIQYVEGQLAVKRRPARAVVPAGIIAAWTLTPRNSRAGS